MSDQIFLWNMLWIERKKLIFCMLEINEEGKGEQWHDAQIVWQVGSGPTPRKYYSKPEASNLSETIKESAGR